ncbi:hypothetical protein CCR94_20315 [Rhodoblastus sphagnicola]|uniref:TonB C-terminal domain-containing protein n=1 Tax=Rhodoblastus sphagnicola TaxID=333368 RepID=A0A2S6MXU2_9HYPH|nr:hypothetical protein [Rhodoblastus sphagnicola]MBB4196652.1 hypothetical protein [Rhodoblastus sphagnicola]PPQ27185.1 hypothetical protein CCR94_20315 [Rhodoblastus sphagnicola]
MRVVLFAVPVRASLAAGVLLAACFSWPAVAAPAQTLNELFAQFRACLKSPAETPEGEITLRFSLRRDGALIGRPHITFARLPADDAKKRAALEAVAAALDRCLPAHITDSLGGAVAGRPLTLRLISRASERGI